MLFLSIHTFLPDRNGDAWITTHSAGHVPALFFVPGYLARQLFMDYNKKKTGNGAYADEYELLYAHPGNH